MSIRANSIKVNSAQITKGIIIPSRVQVDNVTTSSFDMKLEQNVDVKLSERLTLRKTGTNTYEMIKTQVTNIPTGWTQQVGSDLTGIGFNHYLGKNVAISNDGTHIMVGLLGPQPDYRGQVGVFKWNGSSWNQLGSWFTGTANMNMMGHPDSISISSNGQRIAIGEQNYDSPTTNAGVVRIYEWNSGTSVWNQLGHDINGSGVSNFFGGSVKISGNGLRVIAGGIGNTSNDHGVCRVYEFNSSSNQWQKVGDDIEGDDKGDQFGTAVAISSDGNRIAVSGPDHDNGHVKVYDWNHTTWVQAGSDIGGESDDDRFGGAIAMSSDGNCIAIGDSMYDFNTQTNIGRVKVYGWYSTSNKWTKKGGAIIGEAKGEKFGHRVAISDDGHRIIAGAPAIWAPTGTGSAARVYDFISGNWVKSGNDISSGGNGDVYGESVAISGDGSRIVAGAPGYRSSAIGNNVGLVQVWEQASGGPTTTTTQTTTQFNDM